MTSSPGTVWTAIASWLPIDPDDTNSAASFPSNVATSFLERAEPSGLRHRRHRPRRRAPSPHAWPSRARFGHGVATKVDHCCAGAYSGLGERFGCEGACAPAQDELLVQPLNHPMKSQVDTQAADPADETETLSVLAPIARSSIVDAVVERIRGEILAGRPSLGRSCPRSASWRSPSASTASRSVRRSGVSRPWGSS